VSGQGLTWPRDPCPPAAVIVLLVVQAIDAYPEIFPEEMDEPGPHAYVDGTGDFWIVHVCPCCGGRFAWCQGISGEVRVSAGLLAHVPAEDRVRPSSDSPTMPRSSSWSSRRAARL
jgi:hypothetical protein